MMHLEKNTISRYIVSHTLHKLCKNKKLKEKKFPRRWQDRKQIMLKQSEALYKKKGANGDFDDRTKTQSVERDAKEILGLFG